MDSFISGAAAGFVVDLVLYPIDTLKTRLQSKTGFRHAGGFTKIYSGLSAAVIGSVPSGAAFFVGYDVTKTVLFGLSGPTLNAESATDAPVVQPDVRRQLLTQAAAAIVGETLASCTRAPIEVLKQRLQAGQHRSLYSALVHVTHGIPQDVTSGVAPCRILVRGIPRLFTGISVMLLREFPFSIIQMSCYECLKSILNTESRPFYLPVCGALSGATAAFITTPIDVLKTRIMLGQVAATSAENSHSFKLSGFGAISAAFSDVLREPPRPTDRWGPLQRFFRGVVPRVVWISVGGSIFFTT
ncbi:putative carrier protein [Trypanosoma vivax]|nr:putative carrier protein [Trypanosoma vivax]